MEALALRAYAPADFEALHALDQACFPPGIAYSRAELRTFLEHPSSSTAVARLRSTVVGFAIVRPVRRRTMALPLAPVCAMMHVLTIDVDPGARRQGVGGALMRWIFERAAQARSQAVVLEVASDNSVAQSFYQSFGFVVTGTVPGYYNGVTDALQLERQLRGAAGPIGS